MKEDCNFCGVTYDSSESEYEDCCAECGAEEGQGGIKEYDIATRNVEANRRVLRKHFT